MALACNVGGADRVLRVVVGIALAIAAYSSELGTAWKFSLAVVAAIALVTAAIGYCPLNRVLGIDTCKGRT
jgi:hypothetical protein